jgi:PAS domain S-box-containing protein
MMPGKKKASRFPNKEASKGSVKRGEKEPKKVEFLNSIFNAITDGITVIDRDYKIVYINRSLAHFYGFEDPQEVIGKNCYEAFRGDKKICKQCPTKEIFETGKLYHEFHIAPDLHGNEIHWEIHFYPIYDDKGKIESVVEYSKNITREKLMEKRAEESERKLSDIVSASRDVIAEFNLDMEMTFVSPNIEEFSGYSEEEVLSNMRLNSYIKMVK